MKKRDYKFESKFDKKISKLKGKEADNLFKKINEILTCNDIDHYKNLRNKFKKYKRVHVNRCYVIMFFEKDKVYFVDYDHHDKIYK